jgi:hypothetical protein
LKQSSSFSLVSLILVVALAACGGDDDPGDPDAANPVFDAAVTIDSAPDYDATPSYDATPPNPDAMVSNVDCENIPEGPFSLTSVSGPIASEDLAFDAAGNLVGSDDTTIFKTPLGGPPTVFVPNLNFRAGMRYASNGELMINNNSSGSLVRVDADGVQHVVLSGLSYPNGMEADKNGYVYVTEHDAQRVRRIHSKTGEFTIISNQEISNPNGISFNETYDALYIAGFSGVGTVYKLPIDSDGNVGTLEVFATNVGTGWLDGIGVDACGNVYVCDYGASDLYRISPDGQTKTVIVSSQIYMPNLQWGSGIGGFDAMKAYIPDGWNHDVYEVDLGVPSKPPSYP